MMRGQLLPAWLLTCICLMLPTCGRPKSKTDKTKPPAKSTQFGTDPSGSLTGTLSQSLNGGTVGEYEYRVALRSEQTRLSHDYKGEQGVKLHLLGASINPPALQPGGRVLVEAKYALLCPGDQQKLEVVETRRITFGGREVAKLRASVVRGCGTYDSRVPITLPSTAPRGRYDVQVIVSAGGNTTQGTPYLVVQ